MTLPHQPEAPSERAGKSPARTASWWLYRCREDLIAVEDEWRRTGPVPAWAGNMMYRTGHNALVPASECLVSGAIRDSGALSRDRPPPIRLSRIAEWLHVSIRFFAEEDASRFRPRAQGSDVHKARWIRGTIAPEGARGWVLHAGTRNSAYTRETVAHELGHALLFHSDTGIDLRSWGTSTWSVIEEGLVNYMGRAMLAPAELVREFTGVGENLAEYIVAHIASTFQMPHRMAAIRALDLRDRIAPNLRAVVMWRQYHPFSSPLMDACFRANQDVRRRFREAAHELRRAFPSAAFDQGLALWAEILRARTDEDPWLALRLNADEVRIARRVAASLPCVGDPEMEQRIRRLTEPDSRVFFRPEWIAWRGRPDRSYVPERRGSARDSSLVAALASTRTTSAEIRDETVQIGDLKGVFRVHAYAHGDPAEGTRFVLTALEEIK